jgi:hypothetical protein
MNYFNFVEWIKRNNVLSIFGILDIVQFYNKIAKNQLPFINKLAV